MAELKTELETYKKHLQGLMASQGKFVVVHGENILGTFDTYADALKAGYEKVGVKPFLVKRISQDETLAHFSREVRPNCPA